MDKEPAVTIGALTAAVSAIIALLVSFNVDITPQQEVAIVGAIAAIAPLVAGVVIRGQVRAKNHSIPRI